MDPAIGILDFLQYVVSRIIRNPEQATIERSDLDGRVHFEIKVADDDVPRILGRNGRGIEALRNLAQASGDLHGIRVTVKVNEPQGGGGGFRGRPRPGGSRGGGGGRRPPRRG